MRRSAGEGSVRKRVNGTWEGRYMAADGQSRSVYGRTRRDVIEKLRKALTDAGTGLRPIDKRLTTRAFLEDWLEHHHRPRVRAKTYDSARSTVKVHLIPLLGNVPLVRLEPEHVERMLAHLLAGHHGRRPVQPATARLILTHLRQALGYALKLGRVHRNVATLVDPPPLPRRERQPLTAEQARILLDELREHWLHAVYLLAIGTGMRQGEILALRWQDVDFEVSQLAVRHTLDERTLILGEPKTESSRRVVALPSAVIDGLREHRRRQLELRFAAGQLWKELDFVFTDRFGRPLQSHRPVRALRQALADAGLPPIRFHDLRHTYATLELEAGEQLVNISKMLGHANLGITADLYAHLTVKTQEDAARRMDRILAG